MESVKFFESIFTREIARLDKESQEGALDLEAIRRLETLTRAWKAYSASKIEEGSKDPVNLSEEDLIKLARG
jgi:hypothetical protein